MHYNSQDPRKPPEYRAHGPLEPTHYHPPVKCGPVQYPVRMTSDNGLYNAPGYRNSAQYSTHDHHPRIQDNVANGYRIPISQAPEYQDHHQYRMADPSDVNYHLHRHQNQLTGKLVNYGIAGNHVYNADGAVLVPKQILFDETDPKYLCCCESMHVITGVRILMVLGYIECVLALIALFFNVYGNVRFANTRLLYFTFFSFLFTIMKHIALYKENRKYLIPSLVFQVLRLFILGIGIFVFTVSFIIVAIAVAFNYPLDLPIYYKGQEKTAMIVLFLVVCLLCFLFYIAYWLYNVIYKCYTFFYDKKTAYYQQLNLC